MRTMTLKLILTGICGLPLVCFGQRDDPCPDGPNVSNAEMSECYTKAQVGMNKLADDLVARATTNLRGTSPRDKALYGPVVLQALENAATKLEDSQVSWRSYRDQYCDAVASSYTTGSGAGTAMKECLYKTALARVRQLQLDFLGSADREEHRH
jgi:lysozyme inhibitor LprI